MWVSIESSNVSQLATCLMQESNTYITPTILSFQGDVPLCSLLVACLPLAFHPSSYFPSFLGFFSQGCLSLSSLIDHPALPRFIMISRTTLLFTRFTKTTINTTTVKTTTTTTTTHDDSLLQAQRLDTP